MLEEEPSELAKLPSLTSLLPALNWKLCGKEYSSFQLAVMADQIEEHHLVETVEKPEGKHQQCEEQKKGEQPSPVAGENSHSNALPNSITQQ